MVRKCDGNSEVFFLIDYKNKKAECKVRCSKCKELILIGLNYSFTFSCDDPVLNETKRLLDKEWKNFHSKEMVFDYDNRTISNTRHTSFH